MLEQMPIIGFTFSIGFHQEATKDKNEYENETSTKQIPAFQIDNSLQSLPY